MYKQEGGKDIEYDTLWQGDKKSIAIGKCSLFPS
jgi:hypothetical protein